MPLTVEQQESRWLIRMDGQVTLASAGELKQLLLDWRVTRKDLEFDLGRVEEIDISILQLLWAAGREAGPMGVEVTASASEPVAAAARESGFAQVPGFPIQA
jgi:anti-anti-sigma regulatory factor